MSLSPGDLPTVDTHLWIPAALMTPAKSTCGKNIMRRLLHRFWADDDGQDIAEYALMLTAMLLIVVSTVAVIGNNSNTIFSAVAGRLTSG